MTRSVVGGLTIVVVCLALFITDTVPFIRSYRDERRHTRGWVTPDLFVASSQHKLRALRKLQCSNKHADGSRCAVVSAIIGGYEARPHPMPPQTHCCEFFLFTDRNFTSMEAGPWMVIQVEPFLRGLRKACANGSAGILCLNGTNAIHHNISPFNTGKLFKMLFHRIPVPRTLINPPLLRRRIIVWLDGSIQLSTPRSLQQLIRSLDADGGKQPATVALWGHHDRHGVLIDEVARSTALRYISQNIVGHYVALLREGFCELWWRSPCRQTNVTELHSMFVRQAAANRALFEHHRRYRSLANYYAGVPSMKTLNMTVADSTGAWRPPPTEPHATGRSFGVWVTHTLVYKMSDAIGGALDDWWRHNVQFSTQDQVGFSAVVWRFRLPVATWEPGMFESTWKGGATFVKHAHAPPPRR